MLEFLYICDYLSITPRDFFDENVSEPILLKELNQLAGGLGEADLKALLAVAERLGDA